MVHEDFNVWMIEVNTNPSLDESSLYLKELIPRMIDDLVRVTVDQTFLPVYNQMVQMTSDGTLPQTYSPIDSFT